jgi:hypothetical protein
MATPTTPRPIAALVARQRQQAAVEALREGIATTNSPSDRIAYINDLWLIAHPEACSTDADYPTWTPGGAR